MTRGLMKVGSETSRDWDKLEKTGVDALKGRPVMGSKLYSQADPSQESWQVLDLEGIGTGRELWESRVVGPKV